MTFIFCLNCKGDNYVLNVFYLKTEKNENLLKYDSHQFQEDYSMWLNFLQQKIYRNKKKKSVFIFKPGTGYNLHEF